MDFSHYSDEPVRIAVDLVNSYDVVSGEESLNTPDDVARYVDEGSANWFTPGWAPTEDDVVAVRALRTKLRAVFDAGDEEKAAKILNEILSEVSAVPRLSVHGERPHLHFEAEGDSPARWLGAITAMGLTTAMIEGGYDRFGSCDSTSCDDVYVDTSRNRSRRNCSETCTTRENVAAYRSRLKD